MPLEQQRVRERVRAPGDSYTPFDRAAIERPIAERFDEVAARFPDRVAIADGDHALTYADLAVGSRRVARRLTRREGNVALLLPNGPAVIEAMLAALRSGRMFVVLDPSFPVPRLRTIFEDSEATTIVTNGDSAGVGRLGLSGLDVVDLDEVVQDPVDPVDRPVCAHDPAYIVYTSGSTGRPKGIVHTHRGLLHAIANYTDAFRIGFEDRLSLLHSASFSSGTIDVFCALLNGAALHMWDFKDRGFAGLADWVDELTILDWVPTPFRHFVEVIGEGRVLEGPRLLVLASEPASVAAVEAFRRHFGEGCVMVNRLGTSEVFNFRLFFLDHHTRLTGRTVPAGFAVPDKQVLLLDRDGNEVDRPDSPGEIAVRSEYMAAGYWRLPELTSERFRPDPAGRGTVYLTGDRGVIRPDGCLEYLGREDFQIKVRGYRIEPGEIEAALLADPAVSGAAVSAPLVGGERVLTAFVVGANGHEPDPAALRARLGRQLPEHMVPTRFVVVDRLPQTPTGKVDRRSLPVDDVVPAAVQEPGERPEGPTEEALARMWRDLLGMPEVSRHDRFLDLGGHSLLVARLFERIERELGPRLPLATLLRAPTLEQLALAVEGRAGREIEMWSPLVPIRPQGDLPPLFFVHAHGGNVVGYYDLARRLGPDQPFFGLQARGLDDSTQAIPDFEAIAARYLEEVRRVRPVGPFVLGGWCWGGNLAYEMAQQLRREGEEPALLILVESLPTGHPRYPTPALRPLFRAVDRLALEGTLLAEAPPGRKRAHLVGRARRLGELTGVRLEKAAWPLIRAARPSARHSAAYHRHRLGVVHTRAVRAYRYEPYPGRVLLLRAGRQPSGAEVDERLGWGDLVRGPLEVREVPGPSIGMLSEPRVVFSAGHISAALRTVAAREPAT